MDTLPIEKRVDKGIELLTEVFGSTEWVNYISFPLKMYSTSECVGGQLAVMLAPEKDKEDVRNHFAKYSYFRGFMKGYGLPEVTFFDQEEWAFEYGFDALADIETPDREDYYREEAYETALKDFEEMRETYGEEVTWPQYKRYEVLGALWTVRIAKMYMEENGRFPEGAIVASGAWSKDVVDYVAKAWGE